MCFWQRNFQLNHHPLKKFVGVVIGIVLQVTFLAEMEAKEHSTLLNYWVRIGMWILE